jgi:hypothetical protein
MEPSTTASEDGYEELVDQIRGHTVAVDSLALRRISARIYHLSFTVNLGDGHALAIEHTAIGELEEYAISARRPDLLLLHHTATPDVVSLAAADRVVCYKFAVDSLIAKPWPKAGAARPDARLRFLADLVRHLVSWLRDARQKATPFRVLVACDRGRERSLASILLLHVACAAAFDPVAGTTALHRASELLEQLEGERIGWVPGVIQVLTRMRDNVARAAGYDPALTVPVKRDRDATDDGDDTERRRAKRERFRALLERPAVCRACRRQIGHGMGFIYVAASDPLSHIVYFTCETLACRGALHKELDSTMFDES